MPKTSQLSLCDPEYRAKAEARFLSKVTPEPTTGCWLWTASLNSCGYGLFAFGGQGKLVLAHRWAYQNFRGPIPERDIDHLCRVRCCSNPFHLEAVSHRVNIRRGTGPVADNARKTHCKHGHEFTPANTYLRPRSGGNHRQCRTCAALRQQVAS
jgi:hypothetical protein